jgi:hypothetical protein
MLCTPLFNGTFVRREDVTYAQTACLGIDEHALDDEEPGVRWGPSLVFKCTDTEKAREKLH